MSTKYDRLLQQAIRLDPSAALRNCCCFFSAGQLWLPGRNQQQCLVHPGWVSSFACLTHCGTLTEGKIQSSLRTLSGDDIRSPCSFARRPPASISHYSAASSWCVFAAGFTCLAWQPPRSLPLCERYTIMAFQYLGLWRSTGMLS